MHEISEEQARQLGASRVLGINLVIGERASIVDDSLPCYSDMLTPGTLADGAKLTTRRVHSQFNCLGCGATYLAGEDFRCPHYGEWARISAEGSEFYIDSIEIERDDA